MAGPIAYRGNEVRLIHHAFAATSLAGSLLWEPVQTSRSLRARLIRAGRHKTSMTPGKLDHYNNEPSQDAVRSRSAANEYEA